MLFFVFKGYYGKVQDITGKIGEGIFKCNLLINISYTFAVQSAESERRKGFLACTLLII